MIGSFSWSFKSSLVTLWNVYFDGTMCYGIRKGGWRLMRLIILPQIIIMFWEK